MSNYTYEGEREEEESRERLNAAAPELLEACKEALNEIYGMDLAHDELTRQLEAAIAKAEGTATPNAPKADDIDLSPITFTIEDVKFNCDQYRENAENFTPAQIPSTPQEFSAILDEISDQLCTFGNELIYDAIDNRARKVK